MNPVMKRTLRIAGLAVLLVLILCLTAFLPILRQSRGKFWLLPLQTRRRVNLKTESPTN